MLQQPMDCAVNEQKWRRCSLSSPAPAHIQHAAQYHNPDIVHLDDTTISGLQNCNPGVEIQNQSLDCICVSAASCQTRNQYFGKGILNPSFVGCSIILKHMNGNVCIHLPQEYHHIALLQGIKETIHSKKKNSKLKHITLYCSIRMSLAVLNIIECNKLEYCANV